MNQLPLIGKRIDLDASTILMAEDFSTSKLDEPQWIQMGDASWMLKDSALEGEWISSGERKHGQIFTRQTFQGDVLMEFEASTVVPSDHDIIWWWSTVLREDNSCWESGYLGGLGGWWGNQVGIERLVGDKATMAMSPLFPLEPGRKYRFHCGSVAGAVFLFIDGKAIMEFHDPDPLNVNRESRVGFGVFQSHIRIEKLNVYKPAWEAIQKQY